MMHPGGMHRMASYWPLGTEGSYWPLGTEGTRQHPSLSQHLTAIRPACKAPGGED